MKLKQIFPNILLLLLSLTVGLFIVEIVVRPADHEQFVKNRLYVISDYSTFVYKSGSNIFVGFKVNHIHLPSDSRVINSPEYMEWFWICI